MKFSTIVSAGAALVLTVGAASCSFPPAGHRATEPTSSYGTSITTPGGGTNRQSEPDADGCTHTIRIGPDGTEEHHLDANCPVIYPPEGERVIDVGPPLHRITPVAPVEPWMLPEASQPEAVTPVAPVEPGDIPI
ncbi:hypothetical protein TSST111916_19035 [Tsukamurella strandjordii]|uniref:hypothetical protein n=1 Tax=Tsukamurella TaxID=2060 RepID=UPI001C7D7BE8|nr:hypothetical protein [Tsukamurella sp. TY48]GIZ97518.1 hypothetical protein TTY48_21300 [Tsukamurella sp. TY48]